MRQSGLISTKLVIKRSKAEYGQSNHLWKKTSWPKQRHSNIQFLIILTATSYFRLTNRHANNLITIAPEYCNSEMFHNFHGRAVL